MKLKSMVKAAEMPPEPPSLGDVSVQRLIDDSLVALGREVKNLLIYSAKGKLAPSDAKDLRDNLKLLFELKAREDEALGSLTDEDLRKAYESQQDGSTSSPSEAPTSSERKD